MSDGLLFRRSEDLFDDKVAIREGMKRKSREALDGLWDLFGVADVEAASEGTKPEVRTYLHRRELPSGTPSWVDDVRGVDGLRRE